MPLKTAMWIPQYFETWVWLNWSSSRRLLRCSLWCSTESWGQMYFIKIWQFVCITSLYLRLPVILTPHFLTLSTTENYMYHMHKRNTLFYQFSCNHLTIQVVKLQLDILNLNTTIQLQSIPLSFNASHIHTHSKFIAIGYGTRTPETRTFFVISCKPCDKCEALM